MDFKPSCYYFLLFKLFRLSIAHDYEKGKNEFDYSAIQASVKEQRLNAAPTPSDVWTGNWSFCPR